MVRKTNTRTKKGGKPKSREQSLVFNCTSCAQPQLLVQGKRNILCHPQLQVGVCRECLIFAHSDMTPLDEEGYEIYCRWCSELGNLVCCDDCKAPFCEECISRNIGPEYYQSLSDVEEWQCFICEPTGIDELRELTKAVLDHQNYNDPSDLLLEKCLALFKGDTDLNDSDREDIVKERLRLRKNNLNETMSKKKKKKKEDEEDEDKSDEYVSDEDKEEEEAAAGSSDQKDEEEDEEQANKVKAIARRKKRKMDDSDSDSLPQIEEDDEEENKAKARGKKKKAESSDSDSLPLIEEEQEDEEEENKGKARGKKKKADSDSLPQIGISDKCDEDPPRLSSDSEAIEEPEEKPSKKPGPKSKTERKAKKEESDSSNSETSDEPEKIPDKKAGPKSKTKRKSKEDESDSSDLEDKSSKTPKRKLPKLTLKKKR